MYMNVCLSSVYEYVSEIFNEKMENLSFVQRNIFLCNFFFSFLFHQNFERKRKRVSANDVIDISFEEIDGSATGCTSVECYVRRYVTELDMK